jgi:hypothetical protein
MRWAPAEQSLIRASGADLQLQFIQRERDVRPLAASKRHASVQVVRPSCTASLR